MRIRLALLIGLLALPCFGQGQWWTATEANAVPRAAAGCSTADSAIAGDTVKYGYESGDTGTWASWTSTAVLTYDEAYDTSSLTTGKATGQCNRGGHYVVSATAGHESRYLDCGSALSYPVDINFYIYPEAYADGANIVIFQPSNSTTGGSAVVLELYLRWIGGTWSVLADATTTSSAVNLTGSSWNKITLHLDATAASSSVAVNDGTPATFTRTAQSVRYLHFGAVNGHGADETGTFDIDLICVNTP